MVPPALTFTVPPECAGKRFDVCVHAYAHENRLGLSRTGVQKLIAEGAITAGGAAVKAHDKVKGGEVVTLRIPAPAVSGIAAQEIPLKVIYEDADILVIDKQPGLVVHPAPGNPDRTLVNALLHRFKELSSVNPGRPGIVHRLDKETSGVLVVAKTNEAHLHLAQQFADHSIMRRYVAVVKGVVRFDEDVIEVPIGRHPQKRTHMAAGLGTDARFARTRYRVLKRGAAMTLVELEPFTGRTHQLRVHMAFTGHPVMGDPQYGQHNPFPRLALHAKSLGFIHPRTNEFVEFSSPVPDVFLKDFS